MNNKQITSCRVCGGPLVGYMGLCETHWQQTLRFWKRLRNNIEWQKEDAKRIAAGGGTR